MRKFIFNLNIFLVVITTVQYLFGLIPAVFEGDSIAQVFPSPLMLGLGIFQLIYALVLSVKYVNQTPEFIGIYWLSALGVLLLLFSGYLKAFQGIPLYIVLPMLVSYYLTFVGYKIYRHENITRP